MTLVILTRSSAASVIADRTACIVRSAKNSLLCDFCLLANYQTVFGYKFRPTKAATAIRFFGVEIMNAPKRNPLNPLLACKVYDIVYVAILQ